MSSAAIETAGLSKFYGRSRGIEDLDLRVERGEVFGFLGPNGAGKTTTMRLLLDLIRPTSGSAVVCGFDAQAQSLEVRRRTGYLPGELKLPARVTAREYLRYLAAIRDGVANGPIQDLSDRLGLDLTRPLTDLSKGNREKVGVVAAFMHDPDLLILDEPTSGLDPLRQKDVQDLIAERSAAGRTIFLSSHALDQVEHVADRVGIIKEGRLISVESIADLKQRAIRHVEVRFGAGHRADGLDRIPGVRDVVVDDGTARFVVEGPMDALVKELARYPVQTLTSEEPELDEIFLSYYEAANGH